ncbi:hypothetical protein [Thermococcus sp. JdF3]|uniref:hypothetical protein n=1 Tax=Thermococcus sp. JdF3 TaxID=1638258 RepID=UPI00143B2B9A|nr:hypothetical protein [Thermococcus sp. JdF3]NJE00437.1 hypothetical protein [Thermococcus sp. JdF3]
MGDVLLDFRTLLRLLAELYHDDEFDSRTVSADLQAILLPRRKDPGLLKRLGPKIISNDLGRLYRMGFLRRRKVSRDCKNKKGKTYPCGYKYLYRINQQGWDYLNHLAKEKNKSAYPIPAEVVDEVKAARLGLERLYALQAWQADMPALSRAFLDDVHGEIDGKFSGRGYRHFPLKRILFEGRITCWMILSELQREIITLQKELKEKELIIRELKKKLDGTKNKERSQTG